MIYYEDLRRLTLRTKAICCRARVVAELMTGYTWQRKRGMQCGAVGHVRRRAHSPERGRRGRHVRRSGPEPGRDVCGGGNCSARLRLHRRPPCHPAGARGTAAPRVPRARTRIIQSSGQSTIMFVLLHAQATTTARHEMPASMARCRPAARGRCHLGGRHAAGCQCSGGRGHSPSARAPAAPRVLALQRRKACVWLQE
jgi:hypothetical protein